MAAVDLRRLVTTRAEADIVSPAGIEEWYLPLLEVADTTFYRRGDTGNCP